MGTVRGCRGDRRAASPAVSASIWDLVAAAQRGDREAFGRLYDRHVEEVFRYLLARVDDHAAAEDLTGQVFLQAWRGIAAIPEQDRDVGARLLSIARHLAAPIPARLPRPSAPDAHELPTEPVPVEPVPPEPVPVVAGAMDGPGGGHPARTGADLDGEPSGTPVGRWIS